MPMIDNPDTASWRERLAVLLDGLDAGGRSDHYRFACETVEEAATETSLAGLRTLARALGSTEPCASRAGAVSAVVLAWAALPAAERAYTAPEDRSPADALRALVVEARGILGAALPGTDGTTRERLAHLAGILGEVAHVARDL